jgi:hypothetical protein
MGCMGMPQENGIGKGDVAAATCHPGEAFGARILDERWSSIVMVMLTHTAKHSLGRCAWREEQAGSRPDPLLPVEDSKQRE